MPLIFSSTVDAVVTSVFLGGAICILAFALFSYMGLLPIFTQHRSTFYSGKHVLITGGSSGIGKELARILIADGASVTLVARNTDRLAEAERELEPPGESNAASQRVNTFSADCSDPGAVDRMTEHVEQVLGPVDILVNSAGSSVGGYFETLGTEIFQSQMESNYFSHVFPTLAFFKRMATRRSGHIVFVSSMAGQAGVFGQTAYCAAKYAVRGLAETLYFEGKPFGINVTIAFPPDTDTPGYRREREVLPPETFQISETGSLFSAEQVASNIANGVMKKRFRVTFGLIGYLLGVLTAGLTPGISLTDILLVPITRAITPFFLWDQNKIIRNGHILRFPDVKQKCAPRAQ